MHISCSPRRLSLQRCPVRLFLGHELDYEIDTPLVPCTRVILLRRRKIPNKSQTNPQFTGGNLNSFADPISLAIDHVALKHRPQRDQSSHARTNLINESL
jgi:hypothetical protein